MKGTGETMSFIYGEVCCDVDQAVEVSLHNLQMMKSDVTDSYIQLLKCSWHSLRMQAAGKQCDLIFCQSDKSFKKY